MSIYGSLIGININTGSIIAELSAISITSDDYSITNADSSVGGSGISVHGRGNILNTGTIIGGTGPAITVSRDLNLNNSATISGNVVQATCLTGL